MKSKPNSPARLLGLILFGAQLLSAGTPFSSKVTLQDTRLPQRALSELRAAWRHRGLGRYMGDKETGSEDCTEITDWSNWEGFPLKKCTYSIAGKEATVVMLNPPRELLLKWVVAACAIKDGNDDRIVYDCADGLMSKIKSQSGSQFPIAGIVFEPEAYSFRDGVTVELKLPPFGQWAKEISTQYEQASTDPTYPTLRVGQYARIASTTRQQFRNYERLSLRRPPSDSEGERFLTVVRRAYQDAWKRGNDAAMPETIEKYRNDLIAASLY